LGTRRPGDPRLGADPAAAAELARLCGHVPLVLQIIAVLMADDPARSVAELITELADETTRLQAADAAAALANQPVEQIRPALAALARMHLLESSQPGRWRMHDQIRPLRHGARGPRASTRLNYTITVTGLTSGRTASAGLQVITGTGPAPLVLSTSEVKIGDSFFATAWGFVPEEKLRFSVNRADGVIGVSPAGSAGSRWNRIVENGPPGNYTVTVTGLTSGHTASAELKVVQPGS
jgi:hypothetical protein